MSLFVLASKDGWVDIMYDGLDAVGVDQQVPVKRTTLSTNDVYFTYENSTFFSFLVLFFCLFFLIKMTAMLSCWYSSS